MVVDTFEVEEYNEEYLRTVLNFVPMAQWKRAYVVIQYNPRGLSIHPAVAKLCFVSINEHRVPFKVDGDAAVNGDDWLP